VEALLLIGVILLMAFGTLAAVLPIVPGPALVWFGAIIYALATNFNEVGILPIIILTLLMIIGSTTNIWMSALGVKATGGSIWGILGGLAGMVLGMIILFPLGALIGAAAGTLLAELAVTGDWRKALKIGGGTAGGFILGVVAEFLVALVMDIVFAVTLITAHLGR
jgi:uncharacterized protein YqgC (DUF456 family)